MKPHCNTYRLRQARHPNTSLRCPTRLPERAMSSGVPKSQPENQTFRNTPERITARQYRLTEHPVCTTHELYQMHRRLNGRDIVLRHNVSSRSVYDGWVQLLISIKPQDRSSTLTIQQPQLAGSISSDFFPFAHLHSLLLILILTPPAGPSQNPELVSRSLSLYAIPYTFTFTTTTYDHRRHHGFQASFDHRGYRLRGGPLRTGERSHCCHLCYPGR